MTGTSASRDPVDFLPSQRATLDALVGMLLPHLESGPGGAAAAADLVETRLRGVPPAIREDLIRALDALGARLPNLVFAGRAAPLERLDADARARAFAAWGVSRIPVARSAYQALRRFVLSTWYSTAESRTELGLPPPLHTRAPVVEWEGPLIGPDRSAEEPVARWTAPMPVVPGSVPSHDDRSGRVSQAESLRGEVSRTADVVIVGSGAGGAVAAARLAEAGREVVILEEGAYLDARDFNEDEGAMVPRLFADQGLRATVDGSILLFQGGAVGGGTTVNWMLMLRAPDDVLAEWEQVHGIRGYTAGEMAPVFDRIEEEVHARLVPDDAHSPANDVILSGARALGWRASAARINARGCVRAGTCSLGCRYGAKQGALLTYLPRAFAAGARLYADARVDRIEIAERGVGPGSGSPPLKRVRATVRDPRTGRVTARLTVEAPVVVLAAGAVGTPVILERSGLGGGGVGRYLRLHPTTAVVGRYDRDMYPMLGIPQSALLHEFLRRDENGYGFWIESPALQPGVAAAALSGFGEAHRADMLALRRSAALIVLVRDGSGEDRSQGSVWVDRAGNTRIRYRMGSRDKANLVAGTEAAARLHLASGAREVISLHTPPVRLTNEGGMGALRAAPVTPNRIALYSAHLNGTCRMGLRPATSGTTPDGERHGVRGLYVADGSLLPTSLGVNPQETIMAMASMIAERIVTGDA